MSAHLLLKLYAVEVGKRFVAQKKKGDHRNALKVGFSGTTSAF